MYVLTDVCRIVIVMHRKVKSAVCKSSGMTSIYGLNFFCQNLQQFAVICIATKRENLG